jgi:hypothetical protein
MMLCNTRIAMAGISGFVWRIFDKKEHDFERH